MNEAKRLLKNTGYIAIGNIGAKITAFLFLPLYTGILTTKEYGIYDYILTIGAFLLPVVTLSMHEAMFRFLVDSEKKDFHKIITDALFIVLTGILLLTIVLGTCYLLTKNSIFLFIFLHTFANVVYSFSNAVMRGMGYMKHYAGISGLKDCMQVILNLLSIVVFKLGLNGLLLSLILSECIAVVISCSTIKLWRFICLKNISIKNIREMFFYALPLVPNSLSATIMNLSDRIIIKNILGSSANGIYSVSYKFPSIIEVLYHYFYTALSESTVRVLHSGEEYAKRFYCLLYEYLLTLFWSVILLLIAFMPLLFRIFIRGDYVRGFVYTPLLILAMYFYCISNFYSALFIAFKQTKFIAKSTAVAAAVNIIVNIILVNKLGLYAAALSSLLANIILVLIRHCKINTYIHLKPRMIYITGAACMTLMTWLLYDYYNIWKIWANILLTTIYAIVINRNIIKTFIHLLKSKWSRI